MKHCDRRPANCRGRNAPHPSRTSALRAGLPTGRPRLLSRRRGGSVPVPASAPRRGWGAPRRGWGAARPRLTGRPAGPGGTKRWLIEGRAVPCRARAPLTKARPRGRAGHTGRRGGASRCEIAAATDRRRSAVRPQSLRAPPPLPRRCAAGARRRPAAGTGRLPSGAGAVRVGALYRRPVEGGHRGESDACAAAGQRRGSGAA